MAAGLGFKTFNTGDVLSAADTNGYLMQGVLVFADAAARSAAITSPQEGQTSYLKDTDVIQVYSGSAWVTKSGGSSPLTTKGDLYTYSTTDARLPVGTNGHTLVADSAEATGLKWAAPASGASFVGCNLYKTGNQSIAHDTQTALTFDAESFDTDAFHSTSTNTSRITIPSGKGGKYYFGGLIAAQAGSNGRSVYTRVNNTDAQQVYQFQTTLNANTYFSWNLMRTLSVGDYFEVFYEQGSGETKTIYGGSANDTSLYCVYLGA